MLKYLDWLNRKKLPEAAAEPPATPPTHHVRIVSIPAPAGLLIAGHQLMWKQQGDEAQRFVASFIRETQDRS